jgi:hypothetical protein
MASMRPEEMLSTLNAGPYDPTEIHRKSKYLYAKGSIVFLLRAPHGKVWVMQPCGKVHCFADGVDPVLVHHPAAWPIQTAP